ncbi:MAG: CBS domain-containing protein [Cyanobacteria bacterium P01_G01_bin.54]
MLASYCVYENQTIQEAVFTIQTSLSRCVVVLNRDERVVGVFSEGDVLRAILYGVDLHTILKKQLRPSFHYLSDRNLEKTGNLIRKHGITLVPVVDASFHLQQVITIFDVLDDLYSRYMK